MKGLICSLVLVFCSFILKAQYPIQQNIGSASTLVKTPNYGGFQGGLIPYTFADTTAANVALSYLKNYNGALIYTSGDSSLWFRSSSASRWTQILPSGSPSGNNAWLTRGNDLSGQSLPNRLGTKNGDELNIITSDLIRATIPAGGIVRSSSAQNKYLMQDTVGKELYYGDAAGSVPISSIIAATATNTANHANYAQVHQWNTLAGITGFKFSSNSTAAASNAQKLVEIDLSGVNATSNQQTYAMYISNTHTGSVSQNRGVTINTSGGSANNTGLEINVSGSATSTYGIAVGGTSTGSSSWGIRSILSGASPANYAGYFSSTNGGSNYALYVNDGNVNLQPLTASQFVSLDASKNMTSSAVASSILAASLTDEVGTDKVVFNTSPSFVTSVIGGASFDAFNTVSTTLNIGGAATTMTIGGTPTTAITHNYSTNATAAATTKTINFGTGGAASSTTNINIGSANGGTTIVNSPLVGMGVTPTSQLHTTSFAAAYHFVDNADYPVSATDHVISVNSKGGGGGAGGGSIITFPDAGNWTGRIYVVKFYDNSSTTDITIASAGGNVQDDTGNYVTTFTIGSTGYPATKRIFSCTYQSNGTDWELLATGTRQ